MLALICGQGRLPAIVAAAQAEAPFVCALAGFEPDGLAPDLVFYIETLGTLLQTLKDKGVEQVCFAGAIRRPPVDPSRIDAATWPLVPALQAAIVGGDDAALRAVIGIFETAGFKVVGAHEAAPDLLPPPGVITRRQPDERDRKDAARGAAVLATMSSADLGQACVVLAGQVLTVEGSYGTDWMLQSLQARPDAEKGGGVLCKAPKTDQDRRADLPAIGPETVQALVQAGLTGLVLEAGGVMVLDMPAVVEACDAADLMLWIRRVDEE
ncbi:MAG: LpxI family protein [Paracoccaceae bacterium]